MKWDDALGWAIELIERGAISVELPEFGITVKFLGAGHYEIRPQKKEKTDAEV